MTVNNLIHKGNKGEWSEIYVLLKLIADRFLAAADDNLAPLPEKSFIVHKIVREEAEQAVRIKKTYDLSGKVNETEIIEGKNKVIVSIGDLKNGVRTIFEKITAGSGSFGIPEAEVYMREYRCTQIKAASADKSDIHLVIQDRFGPSEIESGFSIKTKYKALPTLLNASKKNTNFTYEVLNTQSAKKSAKSSGAVRDNVTAIYDAGLSLKFIGIQAEVFKKNLRRIDGALPEILAAMLAHYYRGDASGIAEITTLLEADPALKHLQYSYEDYKYKLQQLLEAVALGMTPAAEWNGRASAHGGYIVVRDEGELICFHLYHREIFLEYLFKNTKFDTPSTTRHAFGKIRKEKGKKYLDLNLQIRFK